MPMPCIVGNVKILSVDHGAGGLLKKALSKSSKGEVLNQQDNYNVVEGLRHLHGVTRRLSCILTV
jgi:hypothetical protein